MSKCKTKNRACTKFTNSFVLFKKSVGISQPREAPSRQSRSRFYRNVKTVNPDTHTTLDSFFNSDGFGQPSSANRKQQTFNTEKLELNSINPNLIALTNNNSPNPGARDVANKQKYENGFMFKSQANLEANVGSMDRLQRLKAIQIRNYANY